MIPLTPTLGRDVRIDHSKNSDWGKIIIPAILLVNLKNHISLVSDRRKSSHFEADCLSQVGYKIF